MVLKNSIIAGIDDATKCPCIGSLFIAGVVADKKIIYLWKRAGVKDSKLLIRKKREELAVLIKKTARAYSIQEVTPAMIDNKVMNLNAWEMGVVLHIITDLHTKSDMDCVYIDNWEVNEVLFWERLREVCQVDFGAIPENSLSIDAQVVTRAPLIPEHHADEKYTIVGAASILAKTASDYQYDDYTKIYGDFGSGNPGDPATRLFVWQHRHNPLPIIRTSWNTYKTLISLNSLEEDAISARAIQKRERKKKQQSERDIQELPV
jgi:ribonuclease HII